MGRSARLKGRADWWSQPGPSDSRVRVLMVTSLVAALGMGVFATISLLFLTGPLHLPVGQVGLALTVSGLAGQLAAVPAGRLADRGRCGSVMAASLLFRGMTTLAVVFAVHSFAAFALAASLNAAAYQAWTSGRAAAVGQIAGTQGAPMLSARLRTAGNLGMSVGIPMAGVALAVGTAGAYRAALCVTAASYLVAAVFVARLQLSLDRSGSIAPVPAARRARPWRDPGYLAITMLSAVTSLQYVLLDYALPLWIVDHTSAPRWTVAATGVVNTAVVVALQVPLSRGAGRVRQAAWMTAASGVAVAVACALVAAAAAPGAVAACALLGLGTLALSLGEVWQTAGGNGLSYGLAPDGTSGEYQGFYSMGQGVALAAGPSVMSCTVLRVGVSGWLAVGAMLAGCGLLAPLLVSRRSRAGGRIPAPRRPAQPQPALADGSSTDVYNS